MSHTVECFDDLTRPESAAVFEIVEIAGSNLPTSSAFGAVFEVLEQLVPIRGLALCAPDPATGEHRTVASRGYSDELLGFLNTNYLTMDPAYRWMLRTGARYANWMSPNFDYSKSSSVHEWFRPAGFSGGSTNHLTTQGGYVGELHISTDDPKWPTPRALSVLNLMAPLFSNLLSVFVIPQRMLDNEPPGTCGALYAAGRTTPLPGRPLCTVLESTSRLIELIRNGEPAVPALGAARRWHDGNAWQRVTLVPTPPGLFVMHRQEHLPHGLTSRELDVITVVATGATNHLVARRLGITAATVSRHLERIMEKLDASDRVTVTRIASDEGLLLLG